MVLPGTTQELCRIAITLYRDEDLFRHPGTYRKEETEMKQMTLGTSHKHFGGMDDKAFALLLMLLVLAALLLVAQPLQSTPSAPQNVAAQQYAISAFVL